MTRISKTMVMDQDYFRTHLSLTIVAAWFALWTFNLFTIITINENLVHDVTPATHDLREHQPVQETVSQNIHHYSHSNSIPCSTSKMRFIKPSARKVVSAKPSAAPSENDTPTAPTRWSDVTAGRKSTHPDVAPIKRLLDTTELLELVLGNLPLKDLLVMQRLGRRVREVIRTSSPLQTRLFFRGTKDTCAQGWVFSCDDRLLGGNEAVRYLSNTTTLDPKSLIIKPAIYNSLMLTKCRDDNDSICFKLRLWYLRKEPMSLYERFKLKHKSSVVNATNRSMLLTQPPVTTVNIDIEGKKPYPDWEDRRGLPKWYYGTVARVKVENPAGVTLGDVLSKERDDGWIGNITFPDNFVTTVEVNRVVEGC